MYICFVRNTYLATFSVVTFRYKLLDCFHQEYGALTLQYRSTCVTLYQCVACLFAARLPAEAGDHVGHTAGGGLHTEQPALPRHPSARQGRYFILIKNRHWPWFKHTLYMYWMFDKM